MKLDELYERLLDKLQDLDNTDLAKIWAYIEALDLEKLEDVPF